MTTQHTHSEQNDADASVVEPISVSETNAVPHGADEASSSRLATGTAANTPHLQASRTAQAQGGEKQDDTPAEKQHHRQVISGDVRTGAHKEAASQEGNTTPILTHTQTAEDIRPFTDIIEEFRQSEGRFNASVQQYQAKTASQSASEPEATQAPHAQAPSAGANPPSSVPEQPFPTQPPAPTPPVERPVSPLLRPATRMRLPRQAVARQQGGAASKHKTPAERSAPAVPPKSEAPVAPVPVPAEPAPAQEPPRPARRYRFDRPATSTAATTAQVRPEEHKDGPTLKPTIGAAPTRPDNEQAPLAVPAQVIERETPTAASQPGKQTKHAAGAAHVHEPHEAKTTEEGALVSMPPAQERGQRQDKQRGKAPVVAVPPAPIASSTPPAPTAAQALEAETPAARASLSAEDMRLEDLPPLEYAELQKANSRRRRRRHSGNGASAAPVNNAADVASPAKVATPEQSPAQAPAPPMPTPTPSVVMPRPATPAPTSPVIPAQFSITSGYTLNQMNQGLETSGPFMGPDPSPARGSGTPTSHIARPLRTDGQRSPARGPELAPSTIQHLGNILTQAIQVQTDRMVAELRRANQVPTNISVSLPPFPSNERVGIFVDVANLLYSARTLRMAVDFGKLLDFLRGNRRLVRAQAYCPTSAQPGDEQMFLQAVKGLGYRITTKNYKTFASGAKKADLDLDLCMDVVRLVDGNAVDCIVLVSGDSDFMPMLDYCSDHGVRVEVAAFDEAMSATLRQSCDLFINLSMLEEIRA